jgi:hypothetical protein
MVDSWDYVMAERERAGREARGEIVAWFAMWYCGCTILEPGSYWKVPTQCPEHGAHRMAAPEYTNVKKDRPLGRLDAEATAELEPAPTA